MQDQKEAIKLWLNGRPIKAQTGITVAALLMQQDEWLTRCSVSGEPRFALCGMGVCQECRVTINGQPQRLACQTLCKPCMVIQTASHQTMEAK
ncbi:(2Fe-2S)-binding protein [Undibacterium crateris]|uniref:(2Fe-2S)-binding protein n=1 Tax=Undibacterium crateris TaxID=2528175 RepID=UPI001389B06C|nr:(2Fe-2S)-binding protein [Undibacterium crateris]NDI86009.1 (2Fe-2S)-binding protein [Undibacterium crateris]